MATVSADLKYAQETCYRNPLKDEMEKDRLAYSFGLQTCLNTEMAVIAKEAGYHAILMNLEHSRTGLETMSYMATACLATGIAPIIVVPAGTSEWISRGLDAGAQGIIVPRTGTEQMAKDLVKYAKYRPLGERPLAETPAQRYMPSMPFKEVMQVTNERVLAMPMIETVEGLENVEAIAAVPGVDVLFVGTFDLSDDMGIVGEYDNPKLRAALDRICKAAQAATEKNGYKVYVGFGGLEWRPDLMKHLASTYDNVRYVMAGRDSTVLIKGTRAQGSAMKEIADAVASGN
ncbi:aldolase [Pseudohyphozyma bogoriensis]|nr:aldolase [Pseudohyphozyma bogoriensis]